MKRILTGEDAPGREGTPRTSVSPAGYAAQLRSGRAPTPRRFNAPHLLHFPFSIFHSPFFSTPRRFNAPHRRVLRLLHFPFSIFHSPFFFLAIILHFPFSILHSSAATLESPQIGDFFTLPDGTPTDDIGSRDTPGSDPDDFTGWYLGESDTEIVTNEVSRYRVTRMTPSVQAGVNSTFEGYLERLYYSSQGQSNVWDNSIWGPKSHLSFDFGIPDGGRYYVPTNRVVSRRFTEYSNTVWFAETAILGNYANGTTDYVKRPGWISDGTSFEPKLWWSSTVPEMAGTLIPQFSGIPDPTDPTEMTNAWDSCSPTFYMLASQIPWTKSYVPDSYDAPTATLLREVSFGRPGYVERATDCGWLNTNGLTMVDLVATNFPRANVSDITFDTRRLYSNRLCAMNQYLGLSDRTYHIPRIGYPVEGTSVTYRCAINAEGSFSADFVWDGDSSKYVGTARSVPTWGSPYQTNRIERSSARQTGSIHYRVSGTTTDFVVEPVYSDPALEPPREDDVKRFASTLANAVGATNGYFRVLVYPSLDGVPAYDYNVYLYYDEYRSNTNAVYRKELAMPPLSNETVRVSSSFSRSYAYSKSVGGARLGMTQPGSEGWGRTETNVVGAIFGVHHRRDGVVNSLSDMPWTTLGDGRSDSAYWSWIKPYGERGALELQVDRAESEIWERFIALYDGVDPTDYETVIPMDFGLERTVRNSVRVTKIEAGVGYAGEPNGWFVFTDGYITGGVASVNNVATYEQGTWSSVASGYKSLFAIGINMETEHDEIEIDETEPLAVDAKIGIITRTDWNWKALRRTDDNP